MYLTRGFAVPALLALLLAFAARAENAPSGREWSDAADDALEDVEGIDIGDDPATEPQGLINGGCIPRSAPGNMSLLGVEYQGSGGEMIPKGEIRVLSNDHPAKANLNNKSEIVRKLENQEYEEAAKAYAGIPQPSWNEVRSWDDGVGRVQGRLSQLEYVIKVKREEIAVEEHHMKGSQEDLAKAKDAEERRNAQAIIAQYQAEIDKLKTAIADAQKEIGFLEGRLPALLKGQAAHKKAITPARAAVKQAEEPARQAAAQCP